MQVGTAQCINKGMQRDYSMDKASQEFAYENRNIRITTTGNESFLSVTNEKSTIPYTPIKVSLSLVSNVDTDKVRWEFFVRALSGTDESVNVTVEFKDINNNIIESKDFSLVKHDTFSYHTNIKAVKATIRSVNAIITNYSASTNVEIVNNCDYIDSNIKGTVVGGTVLGNYLVLFTKDEDTNIDYIYKIDCSDTYYLEVKMLYEGNLGFTENAIECISSYESDKVQKVYWVDGVNQPRYINIAVDSKYPETETFNFTPLLTETADVTITKQHIGTGEFTSGVIQYFITFYKKFGAESNLTYESSLYYISPKNRGGEPNEKQTCSFNINVKRKEDASFDGIKIYSMLRSSYNTTPDTKLVYEGIIDKNEITIIDEGKGTPIEPTDVLFLNRNTITASTIEQKDNTLFLGNIKTINITESFINEAKKLLESNSEIEFVYKTLPINSSNNQYYSYAVNLNYPSYILKYFKPREWYRVGFQFKTNTGEWSPVVGVKDVYCDKNIKTNLTDEELYQLSEIENLEIEPNVVYVPTLKASLINNNEEWKKFFSDYNIIEWRTVMAEHTDSTRTVKAQGLVIPTIYNLKERVNETCHSTSLWNLSMLANAKHNSNIEVLTDNTYAFKPFNVIDPSVYDEEGLLKTVYEDKQPKEEEKTVAYLHSIKVVIEADRGLAIYTQDSAIAYLYLTIATSSLDTYECTSPIRIAWAHRAFGQGKTTCRNLYSLVSTMKWKDIENVEITYNNTTTLLKNIAGINFEEDIFKGDEFPGEETLIKTFVPFTNLYHKRKQYVTPWIVRNVNYNTDSNIIKTHENEYFIDANICNFISPDINNIESGINFRLVGSTSISNSLSDYNIKSEDNVDVKGFVISAPNYNFNLYTMNNYNTGITSFPLWPYGGNMFWTYYWNHNGPLSFSFKTNSSGDIEDASGTFKLKSKIFANMWYCKDTDFMQHDLNYNISSVKTINEDTSLFQGKIHKKNYENLLIAKDAQSYFVQGQNDTSTIEDIIKSDTRGVTTNSIKNDIKSVLIKNNNSDCVIVDLGNSNGGQYVLPNYEIDTGSATGFIYENFKRLNSATSNFSLNSYVKVGDIIPLTTWYYNNEDKYSIEELSEYIVGYAFKDCYIEKWENDNSLYTLFFKRYDGDVISFDLNTAYLEGLDEEIYDLSTFLENTTDLSNSHSVYIRIYDINNNYIDLLFVDKGKEDNKRTLSLLNSSYNTPILITLSLNQSDTKLKTLTSIDYKTFKEKTDSLIYLPDNLVTLNNDSKLWIGEFYIDYNPKTFMGGNDENTVNTTTFIPIYGKYNLPTENERCTGYGLEGDTYYQRWDHLRVLPASNNDVNQPIDALSIMVETYKNLDGDVREARGRPDTINLTEENTNNVLNDVYSQPNNYLTYTSLNNKLNTSYYPTMYVWSLHKQALSTVDNWTQINLVNAAKLDEVRGKLTKIKTWNNKLIAFQDKAIALINFNNQTTISTNEGTPVQIANSGKVSGHYYISTTQGCKNKWSITTSPAGVYFIDSYNKSINLLNDGITSLSTLHLFQDWINENEAGVIWNPLEDNSGFKSFYDPIRKDVYFSNNQETLCFNELLNQFVSFYDYSKINTLECIDGHIYSIHNNNLYKMFEGDTYCNLFGEQKDYSITYKINKEPFVDKTWTNIEYRADIFDGGNIADNNSKRNVPLETFDTLEVWNEYQKGVTNLSKAKCKFRIWRADIPRDVNEGRGLNRIRNPWVMLKLSKETNTDKRMEFHDLLVKYLQ